MMRVLIKQGLGALLMSLGVVACVSSSGAALPGVRPCTVPRAAFLGAAGPDYGAVSPPPCPLRAFYPGGGENGYDRHDGRVHWGDGSNVDYGASFLLPRSFFLNMQGEVDLVRWDNYEHHPQTTDWGGVVIFGKDRLARLMRFNAAHQATVLVGPFRLPIGRWFSVQVVQHLSDVSGRAFSEIYLDRRLIGETHLANTYGRPIEMLRAGLVAISKSKQRRPLTFWYGRPYASGYNKAFRANLRRP